MCMDACVWMRVCVCKVVKRGTEGGRKEGEEMLVEESCLFMWLFI